MDQHSYRCRKPFLESVESYTWLRVLVVCKSVSLRILNLVESNTNLKDNRQWGAQFLKCKEMVGVLIAKGQGARDRK